MDSRDQGKQARKRGELMNTNPYLGKGLHPNVAKELQWNQGWIVEDLTIEINGGLTLFAM